MGASAYNLSILKSRTVLLLPIKIRNERWPDRYIRSASSINLKSLMADLARRALPSLTAELQEPAHLESEWSQELWALGDRHLVQRKSGQRVPPSRKHRIVLLWKAAPTLPSDNTPASQLPNDPEKYMCKNVHSLTRFQTHHRPADKEHGINRFSKRAWEYPAAFMGSFYNSCCLCAPPQFWGLVGFESKMKLDNWKSLGPFKF